MALTYAEYQERFQKDSEALKREVEEIASRIKNASAQEKGATLEKIAYLIDCALGDDELKAVEGKIWFFTEKFCQSMDDYFGDSAESQARKNALLRKMSDAIAKNDEEKICKILYIQDILQSALRKIAREEPGEDSEDDEIELFHSDMTKSELLRFQENLNEFIESGDMEDDMKDEKTAKDWFYRIANVLEGQIGYDAGKRFAHAVDLFLACRPFPSENALARSIQDVLRILQYYNKFPPSLKSLKARLLQAAQGSDRNLTLIGISLLCGHCLNGRKESNKPYVIAHTDVNREVPFENNTPCLSQILCKVQSMV